MEYLTTHDLLWVNQIVTGAVTPYHYFKLEAAMAGQYNYGKSDSVLDQAANMLGKILYAAPFESGNRRTALIATLTFLNANGYATKISDEAAADIVIKTADGTVSSSAAVEALVAPADSSIGDITLRQLITHECNHHMAALGLLAPGD